MGTAVNIRCPGCQGGLVVSQLRCERCDLALSGRFFSNEFAGLAEDDLHFLRIFVLCEGHIREMESALGVSYPTIKARLAKLKETLAAGRPAGEGSAVHAAGAAAEAGGTGGVSENLTGAVLRELEAGRISFEQAMAQIKQIQELAHTHKEK